MSKYYKVEDVINTLADQWHYEATIEYPYAVDDIEEWKQNARELFADLPTIEVSEDCISREWLVNNAEFISQYDKNMWVVPLSKLADAPSVAPTTEQFSEVGEWELISDDDGEYGVCSICGNDADFTHYGEPYHYCPNCGADCQSL